ncbi:unnamed protein product, partial [marine sediment metagenome]
TCTKKYPQMMWLTNHRVWLMGESNELLVGNKFDLLGYNDEVVVITYLKPQFNTLNYYEVLLDSLFDTYLIENVTPTDKEGNSCPNYEKFKGKRVVTCVLSLDYQEPIYYQWKDENNKNLIEINKSLIKDLLNERVIAYYKKEHLKIFQFYCYYIREEKEKTPSQKIQHVLEKYNDLVENIKQTPPKYIYNYLYDIQCEVNYCEHNRRVRQTCLDNYMKREVFLKGLDDKLEEMVNRYFGIEMEADY